MEKRSKSRVRTSQSKTAPRKIASGRVTRNPFLNFLRDFRKSNCHKYNVCELTRRGAQLWRGMSQREKSPYVNLSKQAPKYKKTARQSRRRRRKKKKRRRRRRRSRSRSSSIPTGESADRHSSERDRKREKREDKRREDRHSHSHDSGGRKENTNEKRQENRENQRRSNSREKRNQEYELKYKNSKYEDTRDFI